MAGYLLGAAGSSFSQSVSQEGLMGVTNERLCVSSPDSGSDECHFLEYRASSCVTGRGGGGWCRRCRLMVVTRVTSFGGHQPAQCPPTQGRMFHRQVRRGGVCGGEWGATV